MADTVWILIAVVVPVVVIAAIMWAGRSRRAARCRAQADEIRRRLREEDARMRQAEQAEQAERLLTAPDWNFGAVSGVGARSESQTPG